MPGLIHILHDTRGMLRGWFLLIACAVLCTAATAQPPSPEPELPTGPVLLPNPAPNTTPAQEDTPDTNQDAIRISGDFSQEWSNKQNNVALLRGRCQIDQGTTRFTAQKMVIWKPKETKTGPDQVTVYLEGGVRLERPGQTLTNPSMLITLNTTSEITIGVLNRLTDEAAEEDPLYIRARARKGGGTNHPQTTDPMAVGEPSPDQQNFQVVPAANKLRRMRAFPRSSVPYNVLSFETTKSTPPEQVIVITGGVNLLIEGLDMTRVPQLKDQPGAGTVDLSADNVVIWTAAVEGNEFQSDLYQSNDAPLQVYLEGNIVIRQGKNVVRATHAIYDAREQRSILLNAELKSYIPRLKGNVRIRADRIRQLSQQTYQARNAWVTTSQFGKPKYRLQLSEVFLEERPRNSWLGLGEDRIEPEDHQDGQDTVPWLVGYDNTFYIKDLPLLYSPRLSGPAEDPNIPLRRLTVSSNSIFGVEIKSVWDMAQLAGIDLPEGVEWDLDLDYLTDRGPAIGTGGRYQGRNLFGYDNVYRGEGFIKYQLDNGQDNLGRDRRDLTPPDPNRFRGFLRHRQDFTNDAKFIGELGIASDRNFLEQYYEREFDDEKDEENLLYYQQDHGIFSWNVLGRFHINDYETNTAWLPRGDVYALGQPIIGGLLNWSTHSYAGYGRLRPAEIPTDPFADVFTPVDYTANVSGGVFMSRHEVTAPFSLGAVKMVPFVMGEAAFWEEDLTGQPRERLVGSVGIRSSIMFTRVFPHVHSELFNLTGLAHKVIFSAEYAFTESTDDLANIPQYNEFDENAQERFRNRLFLNTFRGRDFPQFDPRFYAVRSGAGSSVTAPYHELIDDQQVLRLGMRHRLQTKVGPPEDMRIKDWMTLDFNLSLFPNQDRDNFGESAGLLDAIYRWNLSERTSIVAGASYDLFENAQQLWNVGFITQRTERGSLFFGVSQVKGGTLDSQIFRASYTYQMSPKWSSTLGTAYDLGENRDRGQSLTLTRIGESFLLHMGARVDASKNDVGFAISLEPRFLGGNSGRRQLRSQQRRR